MNERRYFAHLAESAISGSRPLATELVEACRLLRHRPSRVQAAIRHAEDGDLGLAMERLRLDPLVAAIALLRPAAAAEASRRLRELPSQWALAAPVLLPVLYLAALVVLQLLTALHLALSVLPRIPGGGGRVAVLLVAAALGLALLALSGGFLWMQVRTASTGGLPARVLRHVRAARLCTAAAVLVRHGAPATEAIERLAGVARVSEIDARALLGESGPLDAAALETLAGWLSGEGIRRSRRLALRLKTLGAAALVLTGVVLVHATYRAISADTRAFLESMPW